MQSYVIIGFDIQGDMHCLFCMQAGNVYISNLKIMDGLPTRKGQYCAAPICLLYVNGNSQLVPIAIQLKQEPGEENPIFFPGDDWIDWLLAKIFYQSAHAQVSFGHTINSLYRMIAQSDYVVQFVCVCLIVCEVAL